MSSKLNDKKLFDLLVRAAEKYKARITVSDKGRFISLEIDAPNGFTWGCDFVSTIVCCWYKQDKDGERAAILDAISRVEYGLESEP